MRKRAKTNAAITDSEAIYALKLTVAVGMSRLLRLMANDGYLLPEYKTAIGSLLRQWDGILFNDRPKIRIVRASNGRRRKRTA